MGSKCDYVGRFERTRFNIHRHFCYTNNTVYATSVTRNSVLVWPEGSVNPTQSIFTNLNDSHGIFVTINGNVYADNGHFGGRVDKWTMSGSTHLCRNVRQRTLRLSICGYLRQSLLLSLGGYHRVMKRSFDMRRQLVSRRGRHRYLWINI